MKGSLCLLSLKVPNTASSTEFERLKKVLDDCPAEDDERHYFVLSQLQSLLGELEQIRRLTHELQVHGENIKGVAAH